MTKTKTNASNQTDCSCSRGGSALFCECRDREPSPEAVAAVNRALLDQASNHPSTCPGCAWCDDLTANERLDVRAIRAQCAFELGSPASYPFFNLDADEDESPDATILRVYRSERRAQDASPTGARSFAGVVKILCHG